MIRLTNILNEARKEKSWEIKEKRPIKVIVKGNRFEVPPMKMRYDTFDELTGQWGDGSNSVSGLSYDYEDGTAVFTGNSKEDVLRFIEKNKNIIKK